MMKKYLRKRQLAAALVLSMGVCGTAWASNVFSTYTYTKDSAEHTGNCQLGDSNKTIGDAGAELTITGELSVDNTADRIYGVWDSGTTDTKVQGSNISITVTNNSATEIWGVYVGKSGEIAFSASGKLAMSVTGNSSDKVTYGIFANAGAVTVAGEELSIASTNMSGSGIAVYARGSANASSTFKLGGEDTQSITITGTGAAKGTGIYYSDAADAAESDASVEVTGASSSTITITGTGGSGSGYGLYGGNYAKAIVTGGAVSISASSASSSRSYGIYGTSASSTEVTGTSLNITGTNTNGGGTGAYASGSGTVVKLGDDATQSITITGTGTDGNGEGVYEGDGGTVEITGAAEGAITITGTSKNGTGYGVYASTGTTEITGGTLKITGTSENAEAYGIWGGGASTTETPGCAVTVTAQDVEIYSNYTGVFAANGTREETLPEGEACVSITADKIVISGEKNGLEAYSDGEINLNGDLELTGENAIKAGSYAVVNVNTDSESAGTTKVTGDIVFVRHSGAEDIIDAYVNLNLDGEESSWTGRSYLSEEEGDSIDFKDKVSGFNVSIADGASWTTTGDSFVNNLTLDDGSLTTDHTVNIGSMTMDDGTLNIGTSAVITIDDLTGTGGTLNYETSSELETGSFTVKNSSSSSALGVNYQGITADDVDDDALRSLVAASVKIDESSGTSATVSVAEGIVSGAITADTENHITGNTVVEIERAASSSGMEAIKAVSGAAIIAWREEDATLSQRLGELRGARGGQGIWARMSRGEFKNNGTAENQYNLFQLGYDFGADAWHYGFAVSHNDGESAYEMGRGDNKSTSLSVYGTWLGNKGHYLDVVAKAGRLSTDYDLAIASGSVHGAYKTTGLALSGEYGRRLELTGDWYVTPLAKLSLMRVEGKDYTTSNGVEIDQEALTSALGRVGVELGKKFAGQGSFYLKASYLHEFAGDAETVLSAGSLSNSYTQAIGSSWWEMGFGASCRAADKTYIYADVIRTFGDDFSTPWQWNVGAYWNF